MKISFDMKTTKKNPIWSEFVTYRSIDEGASEVSVATKKLADQMLACMGRW